MRWIDTRAIGIDRSHGCDNGLVILRKANKHAVGYATYGVAI